MYLSKKTECILKLRILFNTFQQKLFKRFLKQSWSYKYSQSNINKFEH
jgi:hypothetical protein